MRADREKIQRLVELALVHFPDVKASGVVALSMGAYRQDALRGALADFILRAGKADAGSPPSALAVLLRRFSPSAAAVVGEYAKRFLPELRCVIADEGGKGFVYAGGQCTTMGASRVRPQRGLGQPQAHAGSLFSPNHQWFLKILLLDGMEPKYWGGPQSRGGVLGISHLAELSSKPQPSASRFAALAEAEGYLVRAAGGLRLQRIPQLVECWAYHRFNHPDPALRVSSLYPGENIHDVVRRLRGCDGVAVSGHLAAHALGLGGSTADSARVFVRKIDAALERLDLVASSTGKDTFSLVCPQATESVFGGSVDNEGLRLADVLQVYLDLYFDPARGREQAQQVFDRVLSPHWEGLRWL
jgi:hypothetical protein